MSSETTMTSLVLTTMTAFILVASIFLSSDAAFADQPVADTAAKTCPQTGNQLWPKPSFADLGPDMSLRLGKGDHIAALESVQLALSEVGDGSTYIWHRHHGKLSGAIRPTQSFKSASGQVCRHIEVTLVSGSLRSKTQTIGCRLKSGIWQLDG